MRNLFRLIGLDLVLLNRNRFFVITALVTASTIALFYLLEPLGNLTGVLVVIIFNDPVVTGYFFAGILLLFDRDQNTLQAISVLPLSRFAYFLSKTLVLSFLATLISFIMAWTIRGNDFNYIHLFTSVFLSAFMFSSFGFAVSALAKNFNEFLLFSIGFLILAAIPFASIFGFGKPEYYSWAPTMGGMWLLQSAFDLRKTDMFYLVMYAHLSFWALVSWLAAAIITRQKAL